jgi:hypothetical protein
MKPVFLLLLAAFAHGEVLRFQRVSEPKEGAFSVLIPTGWRTSGGITRVNPMAANGALNAIGAKLDFGITSADNRTELRWYPEINYFDMRGNPAQAMFPTGSNYNGAPVAPKMNALTFLEQVLFRRTRPQAANFTVKGRYPMPKIAASYAMVVDRMGLPLLFRFDAALLVVQYQERGTDWEEVLYTAVQDWGQAGAGLWTNKDTFSMRVPPGELEKSGRVASVIINSVELNPRWVEGEIRGQMQRGDIAIKTQQEIARLDQEIVEHRRRTNAEINNQAYHNLMGTEEYINPLNKNTEIGSNAWQYRWVNDRGEAIYTDDANFDPVRAGLNGYVKSPVRPRFPSR